MDVETAEARLRALAKKKAPDIDPRVKAALEAHVAVQTGLVRQFEHLRGQAVRMKKRPEVVGRVSEVALARRKVKVFRKKAALPMAVIVIRRAHGTAIAVNPTQFSNNWEVTE